MMKLKAKMTPAELAQYLGIARQTVNRWAREQKWRTESIPGVKGGRARLIVVDERVQDFLANMHAMRPTTHEHQLTEPSGGYLVNDAETIWRQITGMLQLATPPEQKRLRDLLAREGISGFLSRLGIADDEQQAKKTAGD